ncbi:MAG: SDR family oxidoreductase [Pseudomonadota bacterium]
MKTALITAGASGIGYAIAQGFDDAGFEVWITDIDRNSLSQVPDNWRKSLVDVSSEDAMNTLFAEVRANWGTADVLCANAGVAGPTARIEDVSLDSWRDCTAVTLDGAFLTIKSAAPLMKLAAKGSIIVISSTAGQYGYPNRAAYAAAKWGVIGLMKTAAMELGPSGIRVNAICPGSVEGPRMEGVLEREAKAKGMSRDDVYKGYASGTSMGTFVRAEDIAAMAVFLGTDASARISGQVIAVDGHTENPDPKP